MLPQQTSSRIPTSVSRRRFLVSGVRTAGAAALMGLGIGLYSRQSVSLSAEALRPPGALAEKDFSSACVRCGLCVRDCPFDTLSLAKPGDPATLGTPYFTARKVPCEMCDDIPCVKACPTGALDHSLEDIDNARMGLAVLLDEETCLNFKGLRCDVCYRICPAIDQAITLEHVSNVRTGKHAMFIPTVHSEHCTGCGKCEYGCVLEEAAIKVLPLRLAKGELGQHYRWGWEEKEKTGHSLVSPDIKHQYNLPEGQRYDYEGEGLIFDERDRESSEGRSDESPFASDPLETLNRGMGKSP